MWQLQNLQDIQKGLSIPEKSKCTATKLGSEYISKENLDCTREWDGGCSIKMVKACAAQI